MKYFIYIGFIVLFAVSHPRFLQAETSVSEKGPSVSEVQMWAVRAAGLSLGRYNSAWWRMRHAGWAPETKVGWLGGEDRSSRSQVKLTYDEIDGDVSTTASTTMDSRVEVTLRWRFQDLVSHPREVGLLRELRQSSAARIMLLERVTRLYFDWHEVRRRLMTDALTDAEHRRSRIRIRRIVGHLDALTAGRFSAVLAKEDRDAN